MKRREVELGSHSWVDRLAAEAFLNSCFSDAAFVTLFHTAAGTAVSRVCWHWQDPCLFNIVTLAVAGGLFGLYGSECLDRLFMGTRFPPLPPSLISRTVSVDVKHHDHLLRYICLTRSHSSGAACL